MSGIFFLIDQLAIGLYILFGVFGLRYAWLLVRANGEFRATYFELERDLARTRRWNALTGIIIMAQCAALIAGVQQSIVPFLMQEEGLQAIARARQTTDDGVFVTATPPPAAGGGFDIEPVPPLGGDDEDIIVLTPTLTPTPVGTLIPNPPSIQGCDDPRAQLQVPANGMRVFQPVPIIGTAFTTNFARAKIEIRGPSTNNTWWVDTNIAQPQDMRGEFAQFVPSRYTTSGLHEMRLMIFDITDTLVASCLVNIYITEPPLTPTPTQSLN